MRTCGAKHITMKNGERVSIATAHNTGPAGGGGGGVSVPPSPPPPQYFDNYEEFNTKK